ncbi:hypothetical protein, unlikely [Trypanosoma brucei brucei TREU927]|uniref:Uncharacterized protein n=1 Tax=Trypanosoma brucei brucei (strain 927/4 GUTat10.1) TaxID=185431 RepID=Q38ED7_TRYB2|nr:hypothetical protein, unlikely [Trypanosoma brucei brucei TREU927]EAN76833.1 hypothetical protein, unlikely [Trypanosoma brucei brucei TREU927]
MFFFLFELLNLHFSPFSSLGYFPFHSFIAVGQELPFFFVRALGKIVIVAILPSFLFFGYFRFPLSFVYPFEQMFVYVYMYIYIYIYLCKAEIFHSFSFLIPFLSSFMYIYSLPVRPP